MKQIINEWITNFQSPTIRDVDLLIKLEDKFNKKN